MCCLSPTKWLTLPFTFCVWAEQSGGPVDDLCSAEYRPAAVQELRLSAGVGLWPAGRPCHDHHQRHAQRPQPPHPVLRCRLHHLHWERRRQTQDQPGGWDRPAAGRPLGDHPRQLVCPQYCARIQQSLGVSFSEEGDGSMHLYRLGGWRAVANCWRSALLLQQTWIWQLRWNRKVLQQQCLRPE